MSRFHDKWKYSEYVPEGISLNGREFLVTPENGDASGKDDIALVVHEKDARLIAAAPELYKLLKELALLSPDVAGRAVLHARELLARIDGEEGNND